MALILLLLLALPASAIQPATLFLGPGAPATVFSPAGITFCGGAWLVVDTTDCVVERCDGVHPCTLVAGNFTCGLSGDNGPATSAQLNAPTGVACSNGLVFITDMGNGRVRVVLSDGTIQSAMPGFQQPMGIAVDAQGRIYVADVSSNVNKVYRFAMGGVLETIAGNGQWGDSGDGGPATNASMRNPVSIAIDGPNIYVAELGGNRIRLIFGGSIISTYAGTGFSGDTDGPVGQATFSAPRAIALAPDGSLYVGTATVMRRIAGGQVTTVSTSLGGAGNTGLTTDTGSAYETIPPVNKVWKLPLVGVTPGVPTATATVAPTAIATATRTPTTVATPTSTSGIPFCPMPCVAPPGAVLRPS